MPGRRQQLRKTMIKDLVGQTRTAADPGPEAKDPNHIFGKVQKTDAEGAGAVLGKWVGPTLTKDAEQDRSLVEANRRAVMAKAKTAKDFREYQNAHKTLRRRAPADVKQDEAKPWGGSERIFGQTSKLSKVPMNKLVQGGFTSYEADDQAYPNMGQRSRIRIPVPRPTAASQGHDVRTVGTSTMRKEAEAKAMFKMKKYANVESRVGK